jgi:formylglycine-generating enzyme required for sulfatase activity
MAEIPAGRYRMGSANFYPEEGPVREVEVVGFAVDRGPVTVAAFARFVKRCQPRRSGNTRRAAGSTARSSLGATNSNPTAR